jgi:hypothetical protein
MDGESETGGKGEIVLVLVVVPDSQIRERSQIVPLRTDLANALEGAALDISNSLLRV